MVFACSFHRGFEIQVQLICMYQFLVLAIMYGFDHAAAGKLPSTEPNSMLILLTVYLAC